MHKTDQAEDRQINRAELNRQSDQQSIGKTDPKNWMTVKEKKWTDIQTDVQWIDKIEQTNWQMNRAEQNRQVNRTEQTGKQNRTQHNRTEQTFKQMNSLHYLNSFSSRGGTQSVSVKAVCQERLDQGTGQRQPTTRRFDVVAENRFQTGLKEICSFIMTRNMIKAEHILFGVDPDTWIRVTPRG